MNQRISGTYDNIPLSCNKSDRQSASKAKVATFQISFSFSTTRGRVYHLLSVFMNIYDAAGVTSPGPRLNIKTVLSTYGDFHVKDKTAVRTSYL